MSKDIKIVALTKKMLQEDINNDIYWKNSFGPFSRSKASWLVSNPRIDDDEYCGVIGYEGDKMIAFIYMFPDLANNGKGKTEKVYWMISWWVTKKYNNSVLSTYIYNEAINLTGKQILIKSYAEKVTNFYEKQPFTVIASRLRHTIFFSFDASMLIGRFSFLKHAKLILNPIDKITAKIIRLVNRGNVGRRTRNLHYDYINRLDNATWEYIKPLCENDLIYKTRAYVDWQISHLQYTQTPIPQQYRYKSISLGTSNNVNIHNLKIIKDGAIIGFLSYVINYNEFNVKYFLIEQEQYYDICVAALMAHFFQEKVTFIFTDDTRLSDAITKKYRTIYKHSVIKKGLAHNQTQIDFEKANMLNRDGHFY